MDDEYSVTEGRWEDPDAPMLVIRVPFATAEDDGGGLRDAYNAEFQLDEGNARMMHQLIGSWLEAINE